MASGSTVLVTGAAGGIGRALVKRLAGRGARVLATDLSPEGEVPEGGAYRPLDVTREQDWREALSEARERWGGLDVLLNVAGVARKAPFLELSLEELRAQMDVNFHGAALGMHVVVPHMVERGGGHVVNVTSLAGAVPVPKIGVYSASKAALRSLSLAVDAELTGTGVRVSVLGPDVVDTPMLFSQFQDRERALAFTRGWLLSPDELARVVVERVLVERPAELLIPWSRGALARFFGAFPWLYRWLVPRLYRRAEERAGMG